MSAGTRSEGPTPTPEQQAVLDRIAAQRQRLRARHEARQQARAQAAAQMPEGASGVLQALLYLRQHPLAAAAGVAHLQAHPLDIGFEIEPRGLAAANDAALHRQTITRATLARRARQLRKQQEGQP